MERMITWLENNISLHTHDSPREERANYLTHALGTLMALAGLIFMAFRVSGPSGRWGAGVFGMSMVLSYGSSASIIVWHLRRLNVSSVSWTM